MPRACKHAPYGLAAGVLLALLLTAGGCTSNNLTYDLTGTAPTPVRDAFAYRSIAMQPTHAAAAARTDPAPPPTAPQPARTAATVMPPHDAAWEVDVPENPWRWIVIHHSAGDQGSAAAFDAWHRNGRHWDELGYHFVIGNGTGSGDGLVEVGSRWPKQKWGAHCRVGDNEEYNYFGIGICLVGNFDVHRPTEAQQVALARLVDYLSTRYHIDDAHIIGHGTVGQTHCPGRNLSFEDLFARLHSARAARQTYASM
jgi:hypothetical protein